MSLGNVLPAVLPKKGQVLRPHIRKVLYQNVPIELYSEGWLCFLLKRSRITLHHWRKKQILPDPLFCPDRKPGDIRWYTASEIIGYVTLSQSVSLQRGRGLFDHMKLKAKFHEFRARLKKALQEEPDSITAQLPSIEQLTQLWDQKQVRKHQIKFKRKAFEIMRDPDFSAKTSLSPIKFKEEEPHEDKDEKEPTGKNAQKYKNGKHNFRIAGRNRAFDNVPPICKTIA